MTIRTSLLGGAAIAVILAATGAQAQDTDHHPHHKAEHRRHAEAKAEHMDESVAVQSEMASMREQLDQLRAAQQSQAAQDQAAMDQMRAELAQAQSAAQAAQSQLASQIQTIPGVVDKAVAAAAPKTDKLYYKGVTISFAGSFAAIESVYRSHNEGADIGSSYSGLPFPYTSTSTVNGQPISSSRTAEYRETARQSRFAALAEGDVNDMIHVAAYGEVDFLGSAVTANSNESNSFTPRMRVFYSQIDWKQPFGKIELVGGQSWSLATLYNHGLNPRSEQVPLTIDAQYVPGFNWARQPQMRLTADFDEHLWLAVSVENPQTVYYNSGKFNSGVAVLGTIPGGAEFPSQSGVGYTLSTNKAPDVIAKAAVEEAFEGHTLHAEIYGLYRDFYTRIDSSGAYSNQDASGGGVGGGVIVGVIPKMFDLQASGIAGRGIGRYGSGQLPDVSFGLNGAIKPIQEWELMLGGVFHPVHALDVYVYAGEEREDAQQYNNASGSLYNGVGNILLSNAGCETEAGGCGNSTHYVDQITGGFWDRAYTGRFGRVQWGIQYSYTERHLFPGYGALAPTTTTYNPAPVARENMIFTSIRYYPF